MLELVPAKSILARNKDLRWFGIDYQMNLYRGCCHGCIYCDSRSECYGIEEFDRVRGKKNAMAPVAATPVFRLRRSSSSNRARAFFLPLTRSNSSMP